MTAETQKATDYRIKEFSMELVLADGSPATPEVLYVALHDEDAEVQVRAAFGLATLGDLSPSVLDTLFDAADWRRDPEASATARDGIVELSKTNPAIIDRLLAALQQDKVALSGVAECLSEIGQGNQSRSCCSRGALQCAIGSRLVCTNASHCRRRPFEQDQSVRH